MTKAPRIAKTAVSYQDAARVGKIITLKLLGLSHATIAAKLNIPKDQIDFLLWKHLRPKQSGFVEPLTALALSARWAAVYDIRGMGEKAARETG